MDKTCVRCREKHSRMEGGLCPKCYRRAIRPTLKIRMRWKVYAFRDHVITYYYMIISWLALQKVFFFKKWRAFVDEVRRVREDHALAMEITNYALYTFGIIYSIVLASYLTNYVHPYFFFLYPLIILTAVSFPLMRLGKVLIQLQLSSEV